MGEKMTLIQQLRGRAAFLRDKGRIKSPQLMEQAADALAHISQPAQAVDVGAIREVIAELSNPSMLHAPYVTRCADKLTAALPKDSNGAEGV